MIISVNESKQPRRKSSSMHKVLIKRNQESGKKNNVHDLLHKVIYKAEKEKFGSERALVLYSTMLEITNEFCT